jgi:hypothetical protein
MKTPKNFSVKATVGRINDDGCYTQLTVDGPWAADLGQAVDAFVTVLERKGLLGEVMREAFVAERSDAKQASSQDGKGVYYNCRLNLSGALREELSNYAIKAEVFRPIGNKS